MAVHLLDLDLNLSLLLIVPMRFSARLAVTLRLIRFSLFPGNSSGSRSIPLSVSGSCRTVFPDELYGVLLEPGHTGMVTLAVQGALPPAAPFVLFRLKRWGFSGCRVLQESDGLRIEARR